MIDDLAAYWQHTVTIARYTGVAAYGDTYDTPADVAGFVDDGQRLTVGADGEQITATATVFLPIGTAAVPLDSKITLPAVFGGRTTRVVNVAVRDPGTLPLPGHIEVHVQ